MTGRIKPGTLSKIPSDWYEATRDIALSFIVTEAFERSRLERKKIEMRFAHLKPILRLGRLSCVVPEASRMRRDMWRDTLLLDQPVQHWGCTVGIMPASRSGF